MSTHIIDNIAAIRVRVQSDDPFIESYYVLAFEGGDNNVLDMHTDRRCRDWYPVAVGPHWWVMAKAIMISSDMEGGMTRLNGQPKAKAETLIRRVRNVLAAAKDYDQPDASIYMTTSGIAMTPEMQRDHAYAYQKLGESGVPVVKRPGGVDLFQFNLNAGPAAVLQFLQLLPEQDKGLYRWMKIGRRVQ